MSPAEDTPVPLDFRFGKKKELPDGIWIKCPDCGGMLYRKEVEELKKVCPSCKYHFPLTPTERVDLLLDPGSFEEIDKDLSPMDPLEFEGETSYRKRTEQLQAQLGVRDACLTGFGALEGRRIGFGLTDSRFLMGSMGSVVGEKIARLFERGHDEKSPVVFVSGSGGGARMYEGCLSLMQMAKTSAAVARFREAGGLYISVLTHPTMAGVMASFAALGDIIVAEPKA
ncbi:MAG TPA: acetyl-CoA carboxylase carboxyltransferase subunit beta, partial [Planctomycetota bacterium]|nr:acetyl-CoA carboxylase carboxyltransferase subunit beta [Planctomycetota bacterium]